MVTVTLLGTAALMPIPERALTAVHLECEGHAILFDCGEGTQCALRKADVSLSKIDIIAFSHYHGDHIFGLPGLLQTIACSERTKPLYILGPQGMDYYLKPLLFSAGHLPFEVECIEVKESIQCSSLIKGWNENAYIIPFETEHRITSNGYVFELKRKGKFLKEKAEELNIPIIYWKELQKGKSVTIDNQTYVPEQVLSNPRKGIKFVFTGDTTCCESLIIASKDADLLISEATYGENEQSQLAQDYGHMNFAQAALVASSAHVKELWLAHYSPRIKDPNDYLENAKVIFENTICGMDGMQKELKFEID